jgi:hypothetical protein
VVDTVRWERSGIRRERDIKEMTGYFWMTKDVNAFGAFTPSLGCGLYHMASENSAPGIKLWSYGVGRDREWSMLSTLKRSPYAEIQSGPAGDQSIKLELKPGERREHTEFWIPTDKALDIYSLRLPNPGLRPSSETPLFDWARAAEVAPWLELQRGYAEGRATEAPDPLLCNWAPSGMDDLDGAFRWMISNSEPPKAELWMFHYGAWLAGRGRAREAITVLADCDLGVAKALLARLYVLTGELTKALDAYAAITEQWVALHPQVVVERDMALRKAGNYTLDEREKWLSMTDALPDEWLAQRRVQLLVDKGMYEQAKALLLSTDFQKVHQTYTRTDLWEQICKRLGEPPGEIPERLGEDRLARFGAYREFEQRP